MPQFNCTATKQKLCHCFVPLAAAAATPGHRLFVCFFSCHSSLFCQNEPRCARTYSGIPLRSFMWGFLFIYLNITAGSAVFAVSLIHPSSPCIHLSFTVTPESPWPYHINSCIFSGFCIIKEAGLSEGAVDEFQHEAALWCYLV